MIGRLNGKLPTREFTELEEGVVVGVGRVTRLLDGRCLIASVVSG